MKRQVYGNMLRVLLLVVVAAFVATSCGESTLDDIYVEQSEEQNGIDPEQEQEGEVEHEEQTEDENDGGVDDDVVVDTLANATLLADYSADNYPLDSDTWVVAQTTAEVGDFAGLSAAIEALATSGREISLEFPLLEAIPDYAIFGESVMSDSYASDALVSVVANVAKSVGECAFFYCRSLASVELPAATSIGYCAFAACLDLVSVGLPEVTAVGSYAFANCTSLVSIELLNVQQLGESSFGNCLSLTLVKLPVVTDIGIYAFTECALTSVELPMVAEIGYGTFNDCISLTSVSADVVTSIGRDAFRGCTSLSSLSLATESGAKLSYIDELAFKSVDTSQITLTIGSANSEYVEDQSLTIGDESWQFKEIIVL